MDSELLTTEPIKKRGSTTLLVRTGAVIAGLLLISHGALAYFSFMPISTWLEYHEVRPLYEEFDVNETLKFVSTVTMHDELTLRFNDILFCREGAEFVRYSSQNTERIHTRRGEYEVSIWPYRPGVNYPTECFMESNIVLNLPMNVDRHLQYVGPTFKIVDK